MEHIVAQLQVWAEQYHIVAMAHTACQQALHNSMREDEELGLVPLCGWHYQDIHLQFDSQALVFSSSRLSYPYIDTRIGLYVRTDRRYYHEGKCPIGYYRLITLLDGTIEDDYLVVEVPPDKV